VRKSLLRFDDVMNDQRKAIYEQRRFLMNSAELRHEFMDTLKEVLNDMVLSHVPESSMTEQWDLESLTKELYRVFNIHYDVKSFVEKTAEITEEVLFEHLHKLVLETYEQKDSKYGEELMLRAMRQVMMITLDHLWKDHLHLLDHLRTGIGLRAYAQKDPLNEYKIEAFNMFKAMLLEVDLLTTQRMFHLEINSGIEPLENRNNQLRREIKPTANNSLDEMAEERGIMKVRSVRTTVTAEDRNPNDPSTWGKIARNENCPCGSGKKYKYCHGVI
jgi:preprotein translocase subunit SecA